MNTKININISQWHICDIFQYDSKYFRLKIDNVIIIINTQHYTINNII